MAFVVEEERKQISWIPVLGGVILIGLVAAGVYYLFFAPVPLIETFSERSVLERSAEELEIVGSASSREAIVGNETWNSLLQVDPLLVGEMGRDNPFLRF